MYIYGGSCKGSRAKRSISYESLTKFRRCSDSLPGRAILGPKFKNPQKFWIFKFALLIVPGEKNKNRALLQLLNFHMKPT